MAPDAGGVRFVRCDNPGIDQGRNIFRRPNIANCHGQEFLSRITVVLHRRIIDCEKRECLRIINPGGARVGLEKDPVLFLLTL